MWDFLNEAWGGFQSAYEWWNQEGPGAGVSSPPPSGESPYAGSSTPSVMAGLSGFIPLVILAVLAVLAVLILKK